MKEITVKVYQYKELSDEAKEKARDWYNDGQDFSFEWDGIKDDAQNIGLELEAWEYGRYCKGAFIHTAEFTAKAILKEHGKKCETYKTAKKYLPLLPKAAKKEDEDAFTELRDEFLKSLCEDYRIMADQQYDYTQSEEYIADAMEANEYTFLENGKRF